MMKNLIRSMASLAVAGSMMVSGGLAQAEPTTISRASGVLTYAISKINSTGPAASVTWVNGSVPINTSQVPLPNLSVMAYANDPVLGAGGSTTPTAATVGTSAVTLAEQGGHKLLQATSGAYALGTTSGTSGRLASLESMATAAYGDSSAIKGARSAQSVDVYAKAFLLGQNTRITFTFDASGTSSFNDFHPGLNGMNQSWLGDNKSELYAGALGADGRYTATSSDSLVNTDSRKTLLGGQAGDGVKMASRKMAVTFDNATTGSKGGAVWAKTDAFAFMEQVSP